VELLLNKSSMRRHYRYGAIIYTDVCTSSVRIPSAIQEAGLGSDSFFFRSSTDFANLKNLSSQDCM